MYNKHVLDSSFFASWLASLTEDILFFGTVGMLGLIVTTKLPEDETLDARLNVLANSANVDKNAKFYINSEIRKTLCYCNRSEYSLEINNISKCKKYIFIHVDSESDIQNMCKDELIRYDMKAYKRSSGSHDSTDGYVSVHYIKNAIFDIQKKSSNSKSDKYVIKKGQRIHLNRSNNFTYSKVIECYLAEDSIATQVVSGGHWDEINGDIGKGTNWYSLKFSRYTQGLSFKIKNSLPFDIHFHYEYPERYIHQSSKRIDIVPKTFYNIVLESNREYDFNLKTDFYPWDEIKVFFFSKEGAQYDQYVSFRR